MPRDAAPELHEHDRVTRRRCTIPVSDADVTCGVMDYVARLSEAVAAIDPGRLTTLAIDPARPLAALRAIVALLRRGETVHLQLPVEGWGTSLVPGTLLFAARVITRKGTIVLTMHEWMSLHPLRYLSLLPDLWAADRIVFVSEQQRASFRLSPIVSRAKRDAALLVPLGPNIRPIAIDPERIAVERARHVEPDGRAALTIGYFGVLYGSKRPDLLLRTTRALRLRGVPARLLICGDFLVDKPQDRQDFMALADALDLRHALDFRGRIDDESDLMTALAAADVFLLPYSDGVSARRSTFLAVSQLAIPLVTTLPERDDEFVQLPQVAAKLASSASVMLPADASVEAFANAILAAHEGRKAAVAVDFGAQWHRAAQMHLALYDDLAAEHRVATAPGETTAAG